MRLVSRQNGFSMVEVMIALSILAIVMAASIPSFRGLMQSNNLNSSAEKFAGVFRLARQTSVAQGVPHIVAWDGTTETLSIVRDENENGQIDGGEETQGPFEFPSCITVENSASDGFSGQEVIFRPDGSASETGTVELTNDNGVMLAVTLLAPTGQVRVE